MARATTLIYVAAAMQAVPLLTGIAARTGFAGARLWIACWFLVGLSSDVIQMLIGRTAANNLWILYLVIPIMGILALFAMAQWQRQDLARIAVWLMIPLSLMAGLALLLTFEDPGQFSLVVEPMYDLLCLGIALFTMGGRGLREGSPLLRQDWFWICGGFALYYGAAAASSPLSAALVAARPDLVMRALTLQAWTNIVAYLLIATGILCRPLTLSGASSSPSPSAWRSWWSPSARPS